MHRFLIGIAVGAVAGVLDIVPMLLARSTGSDILSAFTHWLFLGLIFAYLSTPLPAWLEGIVVSLLAALPVVILVASRDAKAIIPMVASSAVLGLLSSLALSLF